MPGNVIIFSRKSNFVLRQPCLYIRALQPDHRRRMYTSNALARIAEKLEERLHEVHNMIEADQDCSEVKLKETFDSLYQSCSNFSLLCSSPNTGLSMTGKTRLDKERLQQCQRELVSKYHPSAWGEIWGDF